MAIKNAKIYGKFYSPEKILSYGRPWMFIFGARSIGKSTGVGMFVIDEYLRFGKKFIYIRRDNDEVMETCRTFFNSPVEILKIHGRDIAEFKYDRGDYYIRRNNSEVFEQCGTTQALSKQGKVKSANFSEYFYGIYDEFVPDDKNKYLGSKKNWKQEYTSMISFYQTVDRGIDRPYRNEFKIFFLGNKASYNNPIFRAIKATRYVKDDSKFIAPKNVQWIIEQVDTVEALNEIENSWAYQLSEDSYKNYAFKNRAFDSETTFVEKLTGSMIPLGNVKFAGDVMGVYTLEDEGLLYVCNKPNHFPVLALTVEDHDEINYLMVSTYRKSILMSTLYEAYMSGLVRFENIKCRNNIQTYFDLTE